MTMTLEGLGRKLSEHRRSVITYTVLNLPLLVLTVLPYVPRSGWQRESVRVTGVISLVLLVVGLAITPAAKLLRAPGLIRYRRAIGLAAFFYAVSHTAVYIETSEMWNMTWARFMRPGRRYFLYGIAALWFMVPLAFTSTKASIARMGPDRWRRLHIAVFPALALTCVHYALPGYSYGYWRIYAVLGALLTLWRIWRWARDRRPVLAPAPAE